MSNPGRTPGQANYESYRARFPGEDLPAWDELPAETRKLWDDGALGSTTRAEWGPDSVEYR